MFLGAMSQCEKAILWLLPILFKQARRMEAGTETNRVEAINKRIEEVNSFSYKNTIKEKYAKKMDLQ